jgi:DNA invertase Pin-like site-specific DNA recombinase
MKSAVIYARYSSDRQTEQSIEGQLRECYEFAEREQLQVIDTYIDRAVSGRSAEHRDAFQEMIADSAKKQFSAVIVYKLDRFARNRYDSAIYKAKLKKNGVRVLSAKENITDSPEGIILEGLLESMNEYYSAELAQKVRRGMRENVLKGKVTGGNIALGYRIGADKKIEVDEYGAGIVRQIFEDYASGMTFAEIIRKLNEHGLKTSRGNDYNKNSLHRILTNRRYIGENVIKSTGEVAPCPSIVDRELFDNVQGILEQSNKRRRKRTREDYILTGRCRCGVCGGSVSGKSGNSVAGRKYCYYFCREKCAPAVSKSLLEDTVLGAIAECMTDEIIQQIAAVTYELYQSARDNGREVEILERQLKTLNGKIRNLTNAIADGLYNAAIKDKMDAMERERMQLLSAIDTAKNQMPDLQPEHFVYFLKRCASLTADDDTAAKKKLLQMFVKEVVLYPDRVDIVVYTLQKENTPQRLDTVECTHNVLLGGGEEN